METYMYIGRLACPLIPISKIYLDREIFMRFPQFVKALHELAYAAVKPSMPQSFPPSDNSDPRPELETAERMEHIRLHHWKHFLVKFVRINGWEARFFPRAIERKA